MPIKLFLNVQAFQIPLQKGKGKESRASLLGKFKHFLITLKNMNTVQNTDCTEFGHLEIYSVWHHGDN